MGLGTLSALLNIEVSVNQGVHDLYRLIQASLSAYVELLTSEQSPFSAISIAFWAIWFLNTNLCNKHGGRVIPLLSESQSTTKQDHHACGIVNTVPFSLLTAFYTLNTNFRELD